MSPRLRSAAGGRRPVLGLILLSLLCLVAHSPSVWADRRSKAKGKGKPAPVAAPSPSPAPAPTPTPKSGDDDTAGGKTSGGKGGKPKVFDFTGLDLNGRLRTPQLLYFLERASEELERASLRRRSFIPELVRSIDEEAL